MDVGGGADTQIFVSAASLFTDDSDWYHNADETDAGRRGETNALFGFRLTTCRVCAAFIVGPPRGAYLPDPDGMMFFI